MDELYSTRPSKASLAIAMLSVMPPVGKEASKKRKQKSD
jgi:hypothetical protein